MKNKVKRSAVNKAADQNTEKKGVEIIADMQKDVDAKLLARDQAVKAFSELKEDADDETRKTAHELVSSTALDYDTAFSAHEQYVAEHSGTDKGKLTTVKILLPVAGKYLLPWNIGDEVEMNANQAQELIEDGYAEEVK